MKRIFLLALLIALPVSLWAQTQKIKNIFEEFTDKPGFTSLALSDPGMLANMFKMDGMQTALADLKSIKLTTLSDAKKAGKLAESFKKKIKELKDDDNYKEYLAVDSDGTRVRIYFNGPKNEVSSSFVTVIGDKQAVLLWLDGKIDLSKLKELGSKMAPSDESDTKKGE